MQTLRSWVFAVVCACGIAGAGRAGPETAPVPAPAASATAGPEAGDAVAAKGLPAAPDAASMSGAPVRVKVIPVKGPIARPILYVLRRGLKEAQADGVRAVVIDMETPGGELGVTLEIMEALDKFDGETLVYVDKEAISAGAIISSVADEIHFAPGGVIGAAAAVSGGGEDIPATMKQKINSYLNAKVRSFNAGKGHRAEVVRAMMDADYEFKIGDVVIKPKGELLSLTAEEAAKTYGDPARALLSSGTHATLEDLLISKYGKGGYVVTKLEVTWSERLAAAISAFSPILMGLGLLCVFIEFKTPGFGVFGITGGVLLAVVFFGHYAAGLSGHEPALVFVLGVALVAVEIFLAPGTLVAGLAGATLMLGSLVWSMLDVWPGEMPSLDSATLFMPLLNVVLAVVVAGAGGALLWKLMPQGWLMRKVAVGGAGLEPAQTAGLPPERTGELSALVGRECIASTALTPSGQVRLDGRRYEAQLAVGSVPAGARLRVVGRKDFCLSVEPIIEAS